MANYPGTSDVPEEWAKDFLSRNPNDEHRVNSAYESERNRSQPSSGGGSSGGGGGGGQNPFDSGSNRQMDLLERMYADQRAREAEVRAAEAERRGRADSLYNTLLGRSQQAATISPEDAAVKAQVDAYRAEQERGLRNFRSDAAEAGNRLRPTQDRMAGERVAQGVASMQAELMARELQSRRAEIADALSSMGGILSADQTVGLQRELSGIDNLIRQQQLRISDRDLNLQAELGRGRLALDTELGRGGLSNDLMRVLLGQQTQDDYYNLVSRGRLGNPIR